MVRFDPSTLGIMTLAVASSLSAAFWVAKLDGDGSTEASPAVATRAASDRVLRGADGHYWADVQVNGRAVRMMVDTGSSAVVLTLAEAARLDLTPAPGAFTQTLQTAAGPVRAARVRLDRVEVAGARLPAVDALVVERGLPHPLLGMSFLGRLSGFHATPEGLTLKA